MNNLVNTNIHQPLIWVKPELDFTIKSVHILLRTYTETMNDEKSLTEILHELHLLKGSLEILEFYGAVLLIESMQNAVNVLLKNKTDKKEDIFEALLQATLSLEAYIDKLHKDQSDLSMSLLPIINDIRASINEPLLSESALFLPNLSIVPKTPGDIPGDAQETCLSDSAKSLRPYYQAALLTWYRDPGDQLSLQQMKLVARNLESSSLTPRNRQIWWILGGLFEALSDKGLKTNIAIKLLLGQADRILKTLNFEDADSFEKNPPIDLLKNSLYYISQSSSSGERVKTLKHVYNLNSVIPNDRDIKTLRTDLQSPNSEALKAITKELNKSLDQVKAVIDNFVRNTPDDIERLSQTIIPLKHIADTMSLLRLGNEKNLLKAQINIISELIEQNTPPSRETMMGIASAMLHIESALKNIGNTTKKLPEKKANQQQTDNNAGEDMTPIKTSRLPDAEFRLLMIKVAEEAKNNIIEIKNNVLSYLSSEGNNYQLVANIPALLTEVRGCMVMLDNKPILSTIEPLMAYISETFLNENHTPDKEEYDAFAETLVSIEYYLEAMSEERTPTSPILELAAENLKKLGYEVIPPKPTDKIIPPLEAVVTHINEAPARIKAGPFSIVNNDTKDVANNIVPITSEEIDPEVAEIFIEEAYEELTYMTKSIKSLNLNPSDAETLASIRRIYHTLKGSGKIAGATDISMLAGTIDSYLALVLCDATKINKTAINLLSDAHQLAYQLVDAFQNRQAAPAQLETLIIRAVKLIEETTGENTISTSVSKENTESNMAENEATSEPETTAETRPEFVHLDVIEAFIVDCMENGTGITTPDSLFQAVESLKDSASITGNREYIQTIELLVKYIKNITKNNAVFNTESLDILNEFCLTAREILFDLPFDQTVDNKTNTENKNESLIEKISEDALKPLTPLNQSDVNNAKLTQPSLDISNQLQNFSDIGEAFSASQISNSSTRIIPDSPTVDQQTLLNNTNSADSLSIEDFMSEDNFDLIDIFMEEAMELIEKGHELITENHDNKINDTFLAAIQRLLHTMKGSARMAGVTSVGNLSHALESLIESVIANEIAAPKDLISLTEFTLDSFSDMIEDIQKGQDLRTNESLFDKIEQARKQASTKSSSTDLPPTLTPPLITDNVSLNISDDTLIQDSVIEDFTDESSEIESFPTETSLIDNSDIDETVIESSAKEDTAIDKIAAEDSAIQNSIAEDAEIESSDIESPVIQKPVTEKVTNEVAAMDSSTTNNSVIEDSAIAVNDETQNIADAISSVLHTEKAELESTPAIDANSIALSDSGTMTSTFQKSPLDAFTNDVDISSSESVTEESSVESTKEPVMESIAADNEAFPEKENDTADAGSLQQSSKIKTAVTEAPKTETSSAVSTTEASAVTQTHTKTEAIKVDADVLDAMVNASTEESAISGRIVDHVNSAKANLFELDKAIARTLTQLRDLQFESNVQRPEKSNDGLNLSSFSESQKVAQRLMESIGDIENFHSILTRLTLEMDNQVHQQRKIQSQLHEDLLSARMVTFAIHSKRMNRVVRQTSSELNKQVTLKLEGTDGAIDRAILDSAIGPIEHILRNAIAHGIEDTSTRLEKHKPEKGNITVSFSKDRSEHLIVIKDDGQGLDLPRIKEKALGNNLISDDKSYSNAEIAHLIFEQGLSTADEVSQISGRGIGMDAVLTAIQQLGGSVSIKTQSNIGSEFAIRLPFTLSRNHTLIVNVGDNKYALPSSTIEHSFPVSQIEIGTLYQSDTPQYTFEDSQYPLWYVDTLLNDSATLMPEKAGRAYIVLIKFGQKRIALHVDNVTETRDSVLKPNSPQLKNVSGIAGATVMNDGKVVLIIDIPSLLKLAESRSNKPKEIFYREENDKNNETIRTLIVDDSITVRKVTQRFLSRNGIESSCAKDGLEALEILENEIPDTILLDVEMPNMDGLELAECIKSNDRLRHIPIIMITSRTGKQHRQAASKIGVDVFLGKPYQESELLGYIQALTGKRIRL